jgi:hypothetical protein
MGQFKPMVKMMTTEPSIELKLKKGGHVAMPKMKSKDNGTGSKKMADGGMSGVLARAGLPPGPVGGASPATPSMAARRKAMMGRKKADGGEALKKHAAMPASKAHKGLKTGGVAMGQGGYANGGIIKSTKGETMMHTAKPDRSPAKTGGVKMGNGGGYKKGGNVKKMAMGGPTRATRFSEALGQALTTTSSNPSEILHRAFNKLTMSPRNQIRPPVPQGTNKPASMSPRVDSPRGTGPNDAGLGRPVVDPRRPLPQAINKPAKYAKGGGVEGNVSSTPAGVTNTTTGGVRKGNAGGYKKGGAPKKFARGGSVNDSGKAEKMPQKSPPTPVSINRLSGTYKNGGKVKKYLEGGPADVAEDKQRKAMQKAYEDTPKYQRELEQAMNPLDMLKEAYDKAVEMFGKKPSGESVTKTKESVTVTPLKKRYGGAC